MKQTWQPGRRAPSTFQQCQAIRTEAGHPKHACIVEDRSFIDFVTIENTDQWMIECHELPFTAVFLKRADSLSFHHFRFRRQAIRPA